MLTPQHRKIAVIVVAVVFLAATAYALAPKRGAMRLGLTEESSVGYAGNAVTVSKGQAVVGMMGDYAGMPAPAPSFARSADMFMMPYEPSAGRTAADADARIIKNGYLQLSVDKVAETAADITAMATRRGGFVQSSSVTERGDGTYSGDVSVRVPAKEFEAAMGEIKSFAKLVKHETTTGQDVTEQYTDLEAQLRNAKAQEETYLAVLKQARSVEDILKVQERLGSIRAQIESLQGRLQYLENVTSYSTISVSLSEEPAVRVPTKAFRPFSTVKAAFQTLVSVFQQIVSGLIWAVIVWGGVLLPVALLGWFAWKRWGRAAKRP